MLTGEGNACRVFHAEEILLDLLYATIAGHLLTDVLIIVKEA